jgi:hypothetical protein
MIHKIYSPAGVIDAGGIKKRAKSSYGCERIVAWQLSRQRCIKRKQVPPKRLSLPLVEMLILRANHLTFRLRQMKERHALPMQSDYARHDTLPAGTMWLIDMTNNDIRRSCAFYTRRDVSGR